MGKRKVEERFYITFKHQLVWIVSTAFAIAAALFWKDAITQAIYEYVPPGQTLTYSFYTATLFTVIAVLVVWLLHEIFREK